MTENVHVSLMIFASISGFHVSRLLRLWSIYAWRENQRNEDQNIILK